MFHGALNYVRLLTSLSKLVVIMRPDSILARKLNTFLPLSVDELDCLAEIQSTAVKVKRGEQLTQEGQPDQKSSFCNLVGRAASKTCQTVLVRSSRFR
jgi:hypothetical protein